MNCTESHDLLQERLDGVPLEDRAALARHLAGCSECRLLHAAAARLEDGLRLLGPPRLPSGLMTRIVGQVESDRRRRLAVRRWAVAGSLAAGLLLAVLLGYRTNRAELAKLPPPQSVAPEAVAQPVPPPPSLRDSVVEAGSAMASLTWRTADETVGQTRLLLPETIPAPKLTIAEPSAPSTASLRQAGQGMTAALDPMAASARRAVNLFLREASAVTPE